MSYRSFKAFDPYSIPSPCFVVDETALERNLQILDRVQRESGAKVLLALKGFSMWGVAPLIMKYLTGTCASGLWEAQLGHEKFGGQDLGKEVHTFAAGYREQDLAGILPISHHVVFNSFNQWQRFRGQCLTAQQQRPELSFGMRINPEHSEGATPIYDPCAPCSRLGVPLKDFDRSALDGIDGLHFHTLCEQNFAPLQRTIAAVEQHYGDVLGQLKWVNFGGGHHITRDDYEVDALIAEIKRFSEKWGVQVYLEPGEAIALYAGIFVTEVLDITHNQMPLAIMDTSATCHMPDILEMPYRPNVSGSGEVNQKTHSYRLGGMTCLAGDVIGDYSFDQPLQVGDRLIFEDQAYYTMVKTTTFNGIQLPHIALWNSAENSLRWVKSFDYQTFRDRLS